jgi:hypothetical protein
MDSQAFKFGSCDQVFGCIIGYLRPSSSSSLTYILDCACACVCVCSMVDVVYFSLSASIRFLNDCLPYVIQWASVVAIHETTSTQLKSEREIRKGCILGSHVYNKIIQSEVKIHKLKIQHHSLDEYLEPSVGIFCIVHMICLSPISLHSYLVH